MYLTTEISETASDHSSNYTSHEESDPSESIYQRPPKAEMGVAEQTVLATPREPFCHRSVYVPVQLQQLLDSSTAVATAPSQPRASRERIATWGLSSSSSSSPRRAAPRRASAPKNDENFHSGRWTKDEHDGFLSGLKMYGRDWLSISRRVGTRSKDQTRKHAQKYFAMLRRQREKLQKTASLAVEDAKPRPTKRLSDREGRKNEADVRTKVDAMLSRIANRRRELLWNRDVSERSESWEETNAVKEDLSNAGIADGDVTPRRSKERSFLSGFPVEADSPSNDRDFSRQKRSFGDQTLVPHVYDAKKVKYSACAMQDLADKERIALQVLCGVFSRSCAEL